MTDVSARIASHFCTLSVQVVGGFSFILEIQIIINKSQPYSQDENKIECGIFLLCNCTSSTVHFLKVSTLYNGCLQTALTTNSSPQLSLAQGMTPTKAATGSFQRIRQV